MADQPQQQAASPFTEWGAGTKAFPTAQLYRWSKKVHPNGTVLWGLVTEGAEGTHVLWLTPDDLRTLATQALEHSSGLVVPSNGSPG